MAVESPVRAVALPLADADVTRVEGADARWAKLPPEAQELVRKQGYVTVPAPGVRRIGALYTELRSARVPSVLTLDALFELVHLSTQAMLAEVDWQAIVPILLRVLPRIEAELAREAKGSPSDLLVPYVLARGVVAVARSLLDNRYAPPVELAPKVRREVELVLAHPGPQMSPLLGVQLDYSALAARAGTTPGSKGLAQSLAWLAAAPFVLLGRDDARGSPADVSLTRGHTRAALLLARRVRADIDRDAATDWDRVESLARTLLGPSDDLTLREIEAAAAKNGIDLRDGRTVVDVAKIDRMRHAIARGRTQRIFDPSGLTVRVLPARAVPDAIAIASRVAPAVPGRAMPAAADVLVWLRSPEARGQHGSFYVSSLDAIATSLAPSAADATLPATQSPAWRARSEAAALSAWTTLRHDFATTTEVKLARAPTPPADDAKAEPGALMLVEPHPEAIGRLVSLVRQAMRGLDAVSGLRPDGPARAVLAHVDELLTVAFEVALLAANDEAPTSDQLAILRTIPQWLAALEAALGDTTARAVDVHTDLGTRTVLEVTTGYPTTLYLVVREPSSGRLVLVAGAALPHKELVQPLEDRLSDVSWRARLERDAADTTGTLSQAR
ncbi:MAG: dTDP-D-glucose 4,6-dehydratase [Myxococcaceae bacterium]|nr:dTDP-D-glucose 4,6-dehydratase [Myxococcaceae bacterium]